MTIVPDGFDKHDRSSPATAHWEPIYSRAEPDRVRIGIEVRPEHTNSRGLLHGGLIAALADNAMGLSVGTVLTTQGRAPEQGLITASLAIDFLGKAELGQWLEIDTSFVHAGGRQGVAQAFVLADGAIIARANGTFRFGGGAGR